MASQSSLDTLKQAKQTTQTAREIAKQKAKNFINKYAEHETAQKSSDFINGSEYNRINSVLAGREVGHEITGEKYGREGALGAMAAKDKNIKWTDAYTRKNIVARAKQGIVKDVGGGTLLGAASGVAAGAAATSGDQNMNMLTGALIGGAVGAGAGLLKTAGRALVMPGVNYYRGKKAAELTNMKRKYKVE